MKKYLRCTGHAMAWHYPERMKTCMFCKGKLYPVVSENKFNYLVLDDKQRERVINKDKKRFCVANDGPNSPPMYALFEEI